MVRMRKKHRNTQKEKKDGVEYTGKGEEKDQFEVKDQEQNSHKVVDDIELETSVLIGIETTFIHR
jgi:hypothetical protein